MVQPSSRWSTDTKRLVALFSIILIGLAIYRFNFILGPLAIALLLAYLLSPIADVLERRLRFRRPIAVLLLLLALLGVLILLSILLVRSIITQLELLQLDLTNIGAQISGLLAHPVLIGDLRIDLRQVFDQLRGSINTLLQPVVGRAVGFGADVAQGLIWLIFIFISAFYFMKDSHTIVTWLENAAPPGFRGDFIQLRRQIAQTWNNFFRGQLVLAITMGVVVGLVMWAIGLPNPLIIGVLFGVLEVVPNFGPVIASIPTILIALFQGSHWLFADNNVAFTLVVIVLSFALQQFENVILVPRILGHHLNLHPVAVLVAVIAGASLAGVLGILLASPILATLRDIGNYVFARMLDRSPFEGEKPIFRPARLEDKPRVLEFTTHTWDDGDYIQDVFDEWLADPRGRFTAIELGGLPVAIAKLTDLGEGELWLEGLRVDPAHRHKGIGEALHNYHVDVARRLGARVLRYATSHDNVVSQRLGERTGFRHLSDYCQHTADASTGFAPPERLTPGDWPALLAWLDSPLMRSAHGLYQRSWRWCALSEPHLKAHVEAGHAFGLRGESGLRAWAIGSWTDDWDAAQMLHLDGIDPPSIAEMAQAMRRCAADAGQKQIETLALDPSPLIDALREAGYRREEFTMWILELQLTTNDA